MPLCAGASERITAFDASFIKEAGKATYGRGFFYNGCYHRPEKGLEVSSLAVKARYFNDITWICFFVKRGLDAELIKKSPQYQWGTSTINRGVVYLPK